MKKRCFTWCLWIYVFINTNSVLYGQDAHKQGARRIKYNYGIRVNGTHGVGRFVLPYDYYHTNDVVAWWVGGFGTIRRGDLGLTLSVGVAPIQRRALLVTEAGASLDFLPSRCVHAGISFGALFGEAELANYDKVENAVFGKFELGPASIDLGRGFWFRPECFVMRLFTTGYYEHRSYPETQGIGMSMLGIGLSVLR